MDRRAARFRLRRFLSGTVQRGSARQRIRKMLPVSTRQSPCTRRSIQITLLGMAVWALLTPATPASAQTVSLEPAVLQRIPPADIGDGRYYQQLRIVLEHDDAASSEAISIDLPEGVVISDTDSDGALFDEIRVVYRAVDAELPRFKAATVTSESRIVIES